MLAERVVLVHDKQPFFPLGQCRAGLPRVSLVKAGLSGSPRRWGCFYPEIPRAPALILETCEEESPGGGWRGSPLCVPPRCWALPSPSILQCSWAGTKTGENGQELYHV